MSLFGLKHKMESMPSPSLWAQSKFVAILSVNLSFCNKGLIKPPCVHSQGKLVVLGTGSLEPSLSFPFGCICGQFWPAQLASSLPPLSSFANHLSSSPFGQSVCQRLIHVAPLLVVAQSHDSMSGKNQVKLWLI